MSVSQQSGFQRAARYKFPHHKIHGDGPFALATRCVSTWRVYLFWNPLDREGGHARCGQCTGRDKHKLAELLPMREPAPVKHVRPIFED
jgi:hypothetical protein